jgi:hypothetical protein
MNTTNTTTTATETDIPELLHRAQTNPSLRPLKDAFVALQIANRDLRNTAEELRSRTDELFEQATTGYCYPKMSTHGNVFSGPAHWANLMQSNAAAQAMAHKTIWIVVDALNPTPHDPTEQVEEAIRYICEHSADWHFVI